LAVIGFAANRRRGGGGGPPPRPPPRRSFDLHYHGQVHEVEVDLPAGRLTPLRLEDAYRRFALAHRERFGHALEGVPVEIVNLRLESRGIVPPPPPAVGRPEQALPAPMGRSREAFFDGAFRSTPVYHDDELSAHRVVSGPVLVDMATSTIVVPPSWKLIVQGDGNFALCPRGRDLDAVMRSLEEAHGDG
jgi:N-methylhydantoinase A